MLKEVGVMRWFFEELASEADDEFRFKERTKPLEYPGLLSVYM
jgi:hypothetical protein